MATPARVSMRIRVPTRDYSPWAPHRVTVLCCSPPPPFHSQSWWRRPPETLTMAAIGWSISKRPTCPACSRPVRLCLCVKLRYPSFENKVSVTILQHSLETKHPLNSARIAKLGIKNVDVLTVSDVQFDARFVIWILGSGLEPGTEVETRGSSDLDWVSERKWKLENFDGSSSSMSMKIGKGGKFISDMNCQWLGKVTSFHEILASPLTEVAVGEGFVIKKFNKRKLSGSGVNLEEFLEFELKVPAGSVLLYPSDESVSVDELRGMDFEVKNLIVLDGTWSKAKKVYKENPWLKLLPHLKLDLGKSSLFSEVRRQPKDGCLSTIETIVYALKAAGEKPEERLDGLLEVFSSMVADQRRFKDEKLSTISPLTAGTSIVNC